MMPKVRGLSEKERVFVEEYLVDMNATQAAIRAGFSPRRAAETGHDLRHKPSVAAQIARAQAERSRRTGITQDRVLEELARVAFVNPRDLIDPETGMVLPEATEDDQRVIAGVRVKYIPRTERTGTGTMETITTIERDVRLCDKMKALDMLCKHLGMYDKDDRADEEGNETGVVALPDVMAPEAPPEGTDG